MTQKTGSRSHSTDSNTTQSDQLRGPVVIFMSLAATLGTSTLYVLQPSVSHVAGSLGTQVSDIGVALAGGPIGYIAGLVALVPLIDRFTPRRVLGTQFFVLAAVLGLTALVRAVPLLVILIGLTGACSVVGACMSSLAGRLANPARRAQTLGVITAGISAGILGGRIVGGFVADHLGWRGMLVTFACACAVFAVGCLLILPTPERAAPTMSYIKNLGSIPHLFVRYAPLRLAAIRGALWFFGFCAVWTGLAVALSQPPFSYSSARIGLYALAGLSGLVATQVAGRLTDRVGARTVILAGLVLAAIAITVSSSILHSMIATMVCLTLFDAGLFAAQVANQSTVLAIDPTAPARFNSGYMVVYFVGGSIGTAFGATAVQHFGWSTTAVITACLIALAGVITAIKHDRSVDHD